MSFRVGDMDNVTNAYLCACVDTHVMFWVGTNVIIFICQAYNAKLEHAVVLAQDESALTSMQLPIVSQHLLTNRQKRLSLPRIVSLALPLIGF